MKCNWHDCFTCPYADCINDSDFDFHDSEMLDRRISSEKEIKDVKSPNKGRGRPRLTEREKEERRIQKNERQKQYYKEHREELIAYQKDYNKKHADKCKLYYQNHVKKYGKEYFRQKSREAYWKKKKIKKD